MQAETTRTQGAGRRDAWRALLASRAIVWAAGLAGLAAFGRSERWTLFDPGGATAPFGAVGDALAGPAARWDSVWFLAVASGGYEETARTAFFPLYPLLIAVAGAPGELFGEGTAARLLAGVAISLVAFAAGLWAVHRLAELELGADAARSTVWLIALFPTAFAFSAVYSESLFLALSAGSLLAARRDRWWLAGALGGLAAGTRSIGALLVVPLALLYLYGPRGAAPRPAAGPAGWRGRLRPRFPLGADAAALALVPCGLLAYLAYLALATGDASAPLHAGSAWYREWAGPLGGAWDGAVAAWAGVRQLASGSREPVYFTQAGGDPFEVAIHNVGNFAFLVFAVVAVVGAARRLPVAYAAWAALAVAVPVSYPVGPEPLASLPRYLAVVFPLHMWLAAWSRDRGVERAVAGVSAGLLASLTAAFTAWEWVA